VGGGAGGGGGRARGGRGGACYTCGQEGHISSQCPSGGGAGGRGGDVAMADASAGAGRSRGGSGKGKGRGKGGGAGEDAPAPPAGGRQARGRMGNTAGPGVTVTKGIARFTSIQSQTIVPAMQGQDVLAKAKTGSGKTLAFLIPLVEVFAARVAQNPGQWDHVAKTTLPFVIMTPTRELAIQIARNAEFLGQFHRGLTVHHVIGGTNVDSDRRKLATGRRCDILVCTPGRVNDLMGFPIGGGGKKKKTAAPPKSWKAEEEAFRQRLTQTQCLVLDEADRMVERGFLQQVMKVKRLIAPGHQTLMFSATMPEEIRNTPMLRPGYVMADVVGKAAGAQTNAQVVQRAIVAPVEHHMGVLLEVVDETVSAHRAKGGQSSQSKLDFGCAVGDLPLHPSTRQALAEWEIVDSSGFRIMIFAPCNNYVDYVSEYLNYARPDYTTVAIHGNLSQGKRTRAYDTFLERADTILVTSDASARGLDFPDVTAVVQMGFNAKAEYIHRLGRTGRAGKGGLGVVILDHEVEAKVLSPSSPESIAASVPRENVAYWQGQPTGWLPVESSKDASNAKQVLRAWIGAYAGRWKSLKWDPYRVAAMCERFALALGLGPDPGRMSKIKEKLHIK